MLIRFGMCLFDPDDRIVCWNTNYLEVFPEEADMLAPGLPYVETLRRFYEFNLPAEELPFIERHIEAGLERHHTQKGAYIYQRKDARLIKNEALWLDNGYRLHMWSDVTEDSLGPEELPELKDAIANIDIGFALFNSQGGFVSANRTYSELFPDCVDLILSGTSFRDHLRRVTQTVLNASEYDRIESLLHSNSERLPEEPLLLRRMSEGWLELEARPTKRGGFIMFWTDVSERIRAQTKIATLENRLRDAIESLTDGFALFDKDDRLVICNSPLSRIESFMPRNAQPWSTMDRFRTRRCRTWPISQCA